jgi:hypothetical protein
MQAPIGRQASIWLAPIGTDRQPSIWLAPIGNRHRSATDHDLITSIDLSTFIVETGTGFAYAIRGRRIFNDVPVVRVAPRQPIISTLDATGDVCR